MPTSSSVDIGVHFTPGARRGWVLAAVCAVSRFWRRRSPSRHLGFCLPAKYEPDERVPGWWDGVELWPIRTPVRCRRWQSCRSCWRCLACFTRMALLGRSFQLIRRARRPSNLGSGCRVARHVGSGALVALVIVTWLLTPLSCAPASRILLELRHVHATHQVFGALCRRARLRCGNLHCCRSSTRCAV